MEQHSPLREKDEFSFADDSTTVSESSSERFLPQESRVDMNSYQRSRYQTIRTLIFGIGLVAWTFASVSLAILTVKRPIDSCEAPKTRTLHCGTSTAEARALGCQFDALSFLWIPGECIDAETNNQYKQAVFWQGYADKAGTELLNETQMSEMIYPQRYWGSMREHIVHCAYSWRRQHKGYLAGGLGMDKNARDYEHTLHCTQILMEYAGIGEDRIDDIEVATAVGFSTCIVEDK
ncbi:hypothetical protein F5884DRAFT_730946 [Xylogone sp. PMI_703]|nr:hypothetical protein F5884DRAFT_730946 [Xylogone sp. PMI_703]